MFRHAWWFYIEKILNVSINMWPIKIGAKWQECMLGAT